MSTFRFAAVCALLACLAQSPSTSAQTSDRATPDTVIVRGAQLSLQEATVERSLTAGGVSIVDLEDLRERNVSSLADALRYVPGVWSVSDAGTDDMFFSSRGSNLDATDYDMNGIKLLQDGLPVTTADGNNHNRVIDPLSARYAIAARGANALKYGASTLGGAIDFITPTAHDNSGVDVSLTAGSHGQRLARATLGSVFGDRLDGLLSVESKSWDGYRGHNDHERTGLYANVGWMVSRDVESRFYATILENDQELPGVLTRAAMDADPDQASAQAIGGDYQLNVDTLRLANKTTWRLGGGGELDVGLSVERQELFHPIVDRVLVDFDGPGPSEPVEVFSLLIDTDHREWGTMLRYRRRAGDHDLLFGANYGESDVEGGDYRNLHGEPNGLTTIVDNDASSLEAFATDRWHLTERLKLVVAAQLVAAYRDVRDTDVESGALSNPHDRYSSVNPSIGIVLAAKPDIDFYANVSRLFEAPTNYELQDQVAGADRTLAPMRGGVAEVGTRGERHSRRGGSSSFEVSLYYAQIEDEILSVEDPGAPGTSLATNVDGTTHAGIEALFAASVPLPRHGASLEPLVSMTLNEFSFDGDPVWGDNQLPAAPDYVVHGEIMYRGRNGTYVGPTFDLVGDRYADLGNTYEIDSYTLLGLRAGFERDRFSVFIEARNLRDDVYVASHSVRNVAVADDAILNPGEPLSAYLGFSMQIE